MDDKYSDRGRKFFPGDLTFDTASLLPSAAAGIKRGLIDRNLGMDANMWKGRKEERNEGSSSFMKLARFISVPSTPEDDFAERRR